MRLSPVLMAAFAAVATVGWSSSAKAQPPEGSQKSQVNSPQITGTDAGVKPGQQPEKGMALTKRSSQDVVVETVKVAAVSVPDTIVAQPLKALSVKIGSRCHRDRSNSRQPG